jgi:hypothetical protein
LWQDIFTFGKGTTNYPPKVAICRGIQPGCGQIDPAALLGSFHLAHFDVSRVHLRRRASNRTVTAKIQQYVLRGGRAISAW